MSLEYYQSNIESAKTNIKQLEKQVNRNALTRLFIFLACGIVIFQLFQTNNVFLVLGAILIAIVAFAYLVFRQSKIDRQLEEARIFLKINENEVNIRNGIPNLYSDGTAFQDEKHPYTSDLDIFGIKSLFALINRCATQDANVILKDWLSAPASKSTIINRQEAIEELKNDSKHLQIFQTKMLFNLGSMINLRAYIGSYFHDKSLQFGNTFYKIYVALTPWIFIAGILCSIFYYNISTYLILLAIVHLLWTMSQGGKVSKFSNKIDKVGASLIAFSEAIQLIENKNYSSKLNQDLQKQIILKDQDKKLSTIINELGRLIDKLDIRNNMLVGAILNMIMLWDFKQVMAISKWKDNYQDTILSGFQAVSNYEALCSLAILSYNNPEWINPVVSDDFENTKIHALELKHPLINNQYSVGNDYSSKDHTIALITGSNMAGKSTFLRTIGINAVLAYSGAKVCAKEFSLGIYNLVTYMRIKDSLNESTSTFKAELDRMKFILDRVGEIKSSFFLIDEMLRGTNSVDKYLGSKAVIKKLISLQGKGMLATHDLKLSELESEYPQILKNYHFDIQVHETEMHFDYKLKNGACTIFNASMLLKGIGIDVES